MQVISEEISARMTTMTIKYSEELTLWPAFTLLIGWFLNI